jgi:hypothetical protein
LRQTPNANTTLRNEIFISKGKVFQQKRKTKPKEEMQIETKEIQKENQTLNWGEGW